MKILISLFLLTIGCCPCLYRDYGDLSPSPETYRQLAPLPEPLNEKGFTLKKGVLELRGMKKPQDAAKE